MIKYAAHDCQRSVVSSRSSKIITRTRHDPMRAGFSQNTPAVANTWVQHPRTVAHFDVMTSNSSPPVMSPVANDGARWPVLPPPAVAAARLVSRWAGHAGTDTVLPQSVSIAAPSDRQTRASCRRQSVQVSVRHAGVSVRVSPTHLRFRRPGGFAPLHYNCQPSRQQ